MANRHANKRLRRAIRARMARTGERYQQARARVLEQWRASASPAAPPASSRSPWRDPTPFAELVETEVAGQPMVLALIATVASGRVFFMQRTQSGFGFRWQKPGEA